MQMSQADEEEYYRRISKIESNDNPKAKAARSSASGRFQFIKSTWEGLGYSWKDVFNDKLQWEAIRKLTRQNAAVLENAGCAINFATLYGAHFLGAAGLLKIMRATPSVPISQVTTAAQRKANPTILKGTVKDFCDWLEQKTGDSVYKRYSVTAANAGAPSNTTAPQGNAVIYILTALIVVVAVTAVIIFSR